MTVTQKFIAAQAGVTPKTVSLYIQGSPLVAEKTRRKIKDAMRKYAYFPNQAARSIRRKRFNRIAFLYTQDYFSPETRSPAPHFMAYLDGAAQVLAQHGYAIVLEPYTCDADGNLQENHSEFFSTLSVDGIIGAPGTVVPPSIDETIRAMGCCAVWVNRASDDPEIRCVDFDEEDAGNRIVDHLVETGCRRIAWLGPKTGPEDGWEAHYSVSRRYHAVCSALRRHGLELYAEAGNRYSEIITPQTLRLLEMNPRPDGLICYNFNNAEAVQSIAMSLRLRAYEDFQMIHFASAWEYHPWISNLKDLFVLPERELGALSARHILRCIENKNTDDLPIRLKGKLCHRKDIRDAR